MLGCDATTALCFAIVLRFTPAVRSPASTRDHHSERTDGGADSASLRKSVAQVTPAPHCPRAPPGRRERDGGPMLRRDRRIHPLGGQSGGHRRSRSVRSLVAGDGELRKFAQRERARATRSRNSSVALIRQQALRRLVWHSAASAWRGLAGRLPFARRSGCGRGGEREPFRPARARQSQSGSDGGPGRGRGRSGMDGAGSVARQKLPVDISLHRAPTPACAPGPVYGQPARLFAVLVDLQQSFVFREPLELALHAFERLAQPSRFSLDHRLVEVDRAG
jgi:hypothetical protein